MSRLVVELGADLRGADLRCAGLKGADLRGVNLRGADLRYARLQGAKLEGANLRGARLDGAYLDGATGLNFQIPEGRIIGWKKVRGVIIKLEIPATAKRTATPVGRGCRAEYAEVVKVYNEGGVVVGGFDHNFRYADGETVYPDLYDPDWRVDCTHGIHFFVTRNEAEEYDG